MLNVQPVYFPQTSVSPPPPIRRPILTPRHKRLPLRHPAQVRAPQHIRERSHVAHPPHVRRLQPAATVSPVPLRRRYPRVGKDIDTK